MRGVVRRPMLQCWPSAIWERPGTTCWFTAGSTTSRTSARRRFWESSTPTPPPPTLHVSLPTSSPMRLFSASAAEFRASRKAKSFFVSDRSGHKEIWAMDYDGSNQHQVTHVGSISLSPRISPDRLPPGLQLAGQVELGDPDVLARPEPPCVVLQAGWDQSFALLVAGRDEAGVFVFHGGESNIYVTDVAGLNSHRLTSDRGPTWDLLGTARPEPRLLS